MQVIPVLDLLNGVVVHAKQGARQNYQPIQSQLTTSHRALDIVAALLDVYPFEQLYIADLNAIQKTTSAPSDNYSVIAEIQQRYPALSIWLDAGICSTTELQFWQKTQVNLVIGSENFARIGNFISLTKQISQPWMLSLDYMPSGFKGPEALLKDSKYWPKDVIVMSLANVGAYLGVNTALLKRIQQQALQHHIYAAGGVRDIDDLHLLKNMNIQGALVASALHSKKIGHAQLLQLKYTVI